MTQGKTLSLGNRSRQLKKRINHKNNITLTPEIQNLLQQKEQLVEQINMIQNRLSIGSTSGPLNAQYFELMQKDIKLACQLTDLLTQNE